MKRWILAAAQFYPREWRQEYGKEFDALLDDLKPGWKVFANVFRGAISMQITKANWLKVAAVTAAAGAVVAAAVSFTQPPRYVSTAVMQITPQPDPLRPAPPEVLKERAADYLKQMQIEILSRTSLAQIVQKRSLDLYKYDRMRVPMEDVVQNMRRDIRIEPVGPDGTFRISFAHPDQLKAQAVTRELVTKFSETNFTINRNRAAIYENFWKDQAKPVPPAPTGEIMAVIDPPSLPSQSISPNRIAFLVAGGGGGFLLGLLTVFALRNGRRAWVVAACAVGGFVVAAAASYLIPDRYTSTAVMRITPAVITEDPLAIPPVPNLDTRWPELEQMVLSRAQLASIIQKPRLNLYPKERTKKPLEEIVDQMRNRDIQIARVGSSAIRISFSYSDRYKAQGVVRELVTAFTVLNITRSRALAANGGVTRREIEAHKAGENLELLDPGTLPESPVSPNRLLIAAAGLLLGLLLGAVRTHSRRAVSLAGSPS